ncbi:MAG: hypothetical protein PHW62_03385 [Candidatus Ratteibacteria bacterium]|nr:hypothetical protein [Candidatus Ratteibacteria bacterium]
MPNNKKTVGISSFQIYCKTMIFLPKVWKAIFSILIGLTLAGGIALKDASAQEDRESIYMRILAVNPSKDEAKTVNIKEYLPQEVTIKDIINAGGLNVDYDTERGLYYVHKENIELSPGITLTFTVELKDIWYIPIEKLDTFKSQTKYILESMKDTPQYSTIEEIANEIDEQIKKIITSEGESKELSFKQQVANYRDNIAVLNHIQSNIERMRNFMIAAGKGGEIGISGKAMLENSKLKSDVPSKTATWMVIFMIIIFILVLGASFFFAWIRSSRSIQKGTEETVESSFPQTEPKTTEETKSEEQEEKEQTEEKTEKS